MVKNSKIMKSNKISKKNISEINVDKTEVDIDKKPDIPREYDNYFEKLFYGVIDVFAYSKFYDIAISPHEKPNFVYGNLKKNKENLSILFGEEMYKNLDLIIDEFCAEKFRKFINIRDSTKKSDEVDKKINEFLDSNNESIALINIKIKKDSNHNCLEKIIKNLQEENPEKFKKLIEFEVDRVELKRANESIRFMVGDMKIKPSTILLEEVKECSRLQSKKTNNNSSCVIS